MAMLPNDRMNRVWVLAVLMFVGITIAIWTLKHEANEAKTLAQTNEAAISTLASALEAEQRATVGEGREPVAPSVKELIGELGLEQRVADEVSEVIDAIGGIQGPPGPRGIVGPPPSQASVAAAVSLYCSVDNRCQGVRGRQGPPGEPGLTGPQGPAPTPEQVAEAVTSFCSGGACVGPQGPAGSTGSTGSEGESGAQGSEGESGVRGPALTESQIMTAVVTFCTENDCTGPQGLRGPGPTETQVREAVTRFCADGACVGPRGPRGPRGLRGERGPRGHSIKDVRFEGSPPECRLVLVLSNGDRVSAPVSPSLC